MSPASWPGLPRAQLVDDRLASSKLLSGSQFPLPQKGRWTCCLQLLHPPSPSWELKETVPTPSLARDPGARLAQLEEAGWRAGRRPCPVPFPWDSCSLLLSWPQGPSCDSGFLEEAWRVQRTPRRAHRVPICSPTCVSHHHPCGYMQWALPACPLCPHPLEESLCGWHPQLPHRLLVLGQQPLLCPALVLPKQTFSLLHLPAGSAAECPLGLHCSLACCLGAHLLGIAM